jgi:hypothetical protein
MFYLKTRTLFIAALVTASVGVISFESHDENVLATANCSCQKTVQAGPSQCETKASSEWLNWLIGNSGSAQFHYLDLLELLLSSDSRSKNANLTGF